MRFDIELLGWEEIDDMGPDDVALPDLLTFLHPFAISVSFIVLVGGAMSLHFVQLS